MKTSCTLLLWQTSTKDMSFLCIAHTCDLEASWAVCKKGRRKNKPPDVEPIFTQTFSKNLSFHILLLAAAVEIKNFSKAVLV